MAMRIPSSHIYESSRVDSNLNQGDVIHLTGDLKKEFLRHFNFSFDPEYLMIVSQSCDLVRRKKNVPKINHIILSLIIPFQNYINHTIKSLNSIKIANGTKLIKDNDYVVLRDKIFGLVNNANAKAHTFLPKKKPFSSHMVALFNTVYPLRYQEKYDAIAKK